jgi:hypothetical protein
VSVFSPRPAIPSVARVFPYLGGHPAFPSLLSGLAPDSGHFGRKIGNTEISVNLVSDFRISKTSIVDIVMPGATAFDS